jgi:hypothetical protein
VGSFGIIDGFRTSFDIGADLVIVRSRERVQVVEAVDSNSIFRGVVAHSTSKMGDFAILDIVSSFTTNKEPITAEDSISSESRTLFKADSGTRHIGKEEVRNAP